MSRAMAEAFVRNLKLFNAKERDHLMRYAYLGARDDYEVASTFLSEEIDWDLRRVADLGLSPSAACVFAGMDYHLDWLHAALWTARHSPEWTPGAPYPPVPMDAHAPVSRVDALYTDFRTVSGSQEDIDLLVVYADGDRLAVLFIEAKGAAKFDKVQLARKLIRLDRILVGTDMAPQDDRSLEFRLILAAPEKPAFEKQCCLAYAMSLPEPTAGEDKFAAMRETLEANTSGIGKGLHFLQIPGFPKQPHAVTRVSGAEAFSHWTLKRRA